MELKEHFNDLYDLKVDKKELEEKLVENIAKMYEIKALKYDNVVLQASPSKGNKMSYFLNQNELLEKDLEEINIEIERVKLKHREEIKNATHVLIEQQVLRFYYIEEYGIMKIADKLYYSQRQICRIKKVADEKLKRYINLVI